MDTAAFETLQWQVLDAYFQHHGHAHHQLHGWEHFLKTILHEIVREHGTVHVTVGDERKQKHTVSFLELRVWPPSVRESTGEVRPVTPNECLLRGLTLKNNITCNILHEVVFYDADGEVDASKPTLCRRYHDLSICEIPAMVGIRYDDDKAPHKQQCLFDDGGYFIIGGQERSLTSQLKLRVNTLYIFEGKTLGKYSYVAEIRSLHSTKYRSTSTLRVGVVQKKDEATNIVCIVPFLKKSSTTPLEIGLAGMFTLLGVPDRAEALTMMALPTPACQALVERALDACMFKTMTRAEILVWVGKHGTTETTREKQARYVFHIFQNETLPHIGMNEKIETLRAKAFFLAKMVRDLVSVHFGLRAPTCRDHNRNKKLDGPGPLMAVLFRQIYRNFMKTFRQAFTKALESKKTLVCMQDFINPSRITGNLTYHFATGNWSLQKGLNMFVQNLNRVCRVATYSQMRRVNTPMNKDGGKSTAPRQLPMSDWGIFCPVETPEGPTVGMTKNLALTTHVSNTTLDAALLEPRVLEWLALTPFTPATRDSVVYLDGKMVGTTKDVNTTRRQAVLMRRAQDGLPFDCSIYVEEHDLFIYTTVGRMVRPVFVLENLHRATAIVQQSSGDLFAELLFAGVLEYLDKAEEEYIFCASTLEQAQTSPQYTHVEIHGICTLGFAAALIPFAGNNQAPRLTFQAAQCKQAIGAAPLNLADRMDLHAFYQETPQRPLVHTRVEQLRHQSALPSGMSCIVAVLSLSGFNQEDSILVKKQFAERGGGVKTYYHTFTAECSTKNDETFERPNLKEVVPRAKTNYQSIDEDGFPPVGCTVKEGDVIIGKTIETCEIDSTGKQMRRKKDKSVVLRQGEGGVVDKVMLTSSTNGTLLARIRLRERSGPEVGDKFCVALSSYVMTTDGWVQLKDITLEHKVATLRDGQYLDYVHPTNKYIFDCYDEELYHLDAQQVKMICTKNHKLYVKKRDRKQFEFVEAQHAFGRRVRHKKDATNDRVDQEFMHIGDTQYTMDLFLTWLGSFIAEGYVEKTDRQFGALPQFVWQLSQRQSVILMNALLQGDDSAGYYTSSRRLAEDVQRLALHCGWSGTIELCKAEAKDGLVVRIAKKNNNPQVHSPTEEYVRYTGQVGCIEVPETHLFFYKEDLYSPPVWTGNSSRHGQKGTIGCIVSEEDLCFTSDGTTPDIVINSLALPSRMTMGQLIECLLGKVCALTGNLGDGTPFRGTSVETIADALQAQGFSRYGKEPMYSGETGLPLKGQVFIGPTCYQILKHLVGKKMYSRNLGPVTIKNRHPTEGRSRRGGLRFGEMERDVVLVAGCPLLARDRLFEQSDYYTAYVCTSCGMLAVPPNDQRYGKTRYQNARCNLCVDSTVVETEIPYSMKQQIQMLEGLHIGVSMTVQPKKT